MTAKLCGVQLQLVSFLAVSAVLIVAPGPDMALVARYVVGVSYLLFLVVQALRTAWRPREQAAAMPHARTRHAFRQGLLSNLGNPKIAVFFTSFLPQFTTANTSSFSLLVLGLLFCAMTFAWLVGYGAMVAKAGDVLRRPRVRRVLEGLTGAVLIAFGLRLATER